MLDGGLPQCLLEGIKCLEVSWILLQDIPSPAEHDSTECKENFISSVNLKDF